MKIDLKKLNGAGSVPFTGSVDLSEEEMYGVHPFQHPVLYEGVIERHLDVLTLRGTIRTTYSTPCARCLTPLDIPISAEVDMILTHDALSEEDDVFVLTDDFVEVEDVLVPALLLQVEMTYLCKEDCKGLCPICGADRNKTDCGCQTTDIDPRLAVLSSLFNK